MTSFGGLREVLDNQSTERVMQENPEFVPSSSGRDGAGTSTATVNNSELPSFAFKAVGDRPPVNAADVPPYKRSNTHTQPPLEGTSWGTRILNVSTLKPASDLKSWLNG